MKIKAGFVLRNVCNSFIVVAVGAQAKDFKGMIKLNETGAFLWELLQKEQTDDQLLAALQEEYDVDEETARSGVEAFVKSLRDADLLV